MDYTPIPESTPEALAEAEAVLFPVDRDGLQLVRAKFPGGEYLSTGLFRAEDITGNGRGRTAENVKSICSVFFDTDLVGLFKAKYLATGKPSLGSRAAAWKSAMYAYPQDRLFAAKQKHGRMVLDALTDLLGEPTATVDSGWGWHYFYALEGVPVSSLPLLVDLHNRVRPLVHARVAEGWGCPFPDPVLDATQDAGTRVVRRWRSMNTKAPGSPRPCIPVAASAARITPERLTALLTALPPVQTSAPAKPKAARPVQATRAPAPQPSGDIPTGHVLDFSSHTHDGQTWRDIVEALDVGEVHKLTCPWGGTSHGSGFLSRKSATRALYRSNALGRTWWSKDPIQAADRATLDMRLDKDGDPKGVKQSILNVYRLLRDDAEMDLWTCTFRQLPMLGSEQLDPKAMQTRVRMLAEEKYDWTMKVARQDVENAILDVCEETQRNGIAEELETLEWDKKGRLYKWLAKTLGIEHGRLLSAYGRRWFVSLVARCMQPGCKVDNMLVVLGRQGIGKSSLFRQISEYFGEDLFVDSSVDWRHKDSRDVLRGTLIFEDAELESFHRAGVDLMKNLLSSEVDTYRAAYGRTRQRYPRTAVLVGTANPVDILKDQTGNRRFWLVNAYQTSRSFYDHQWLADNLEQLVAEALDIYRRQVASPSPQTQWWLTPEEQSLSDADNQAALQEDLIAAAAERVYEANNGMPGAAITAMDFVRAYSMAHGISAPSNRQLQSMVQKASHALRQCGFTRQKMTCPVRRIRANYYCRPPTWEVGTCQPNDGLAAIEMDAEPDNVRSLRSPQ